MKKTLLTIIFIFSISFFSKIWSQNEFITIWKPNNLSSTIDNYPNISGNSRVWMPLTGVNFKVQWEEIGYPQHNATLNSVSAYGQLYVNFGNPLNPNPDEATYRVKISNGNGNFHRIQFAQLALDVNGNMVPKYMGDIYKIMEVEQWGSTIWSDMQAAFYRADNLKISATDTPNLSQITDASYMFYNAYGFQTNASMGNWDVSTIQNFKAMFGHEYSGNPNEAFNVNLNNWNVSNAVNLSEMFKNRGLFNSPLSNWNVSNVTDLSSTFLGCKSFNQSINNWNVSNVTTLNSTFNNCIVFNQPLNNWDTSSVTDLMSTFSNCTNFNQSLNDWDTSSVTSMQSTLTYCSNFNQPLNNWNTSNVLTMRNLFSQCSVFNQPLNDWDVSNVTDMGFLFLNCFAFNQPLNNWDTSSAQNMLFMFAAASSFNQDIGVWDLSALNSATMMLNLSGISCNNYSKILEGWSTNPNTPNNIGLGTVNLMYSVDAVPFRDILISKNWIMTGDSLGECRMLNTKDINIDKNFTIYPNPASETIFIKTNLEISKISISEASGRLVKVVKGNNKKIDVSDLTIGTYYLNIDTKDQTIVEKFIKK